MSDTTIRTAKVVAVLLTDGWHHVVQGSFTVGALGFGADADPDVLGFRFEEADTASPYRRPAALAGPLGSVIAVRQVTSAARRLGALDRPDARPGTRWTPEALPQQASLLVESNLSR